jgi:outer membrane biosynthesis protein TonB
MDVRFERVAEAVAAVCDFEHLALMSSKQTVRPRACKVVLKPVTFACGAYTRAVADATATAVGAAVTVAQQQQQQQQSPPPQEEQAPLPPLAAQQEQAAAAAVVSQQQQQQQQPTVMQVKLEVVQPQQHHQQQQQQQQQPPLPIKLKPEAVPATVGPTAKTTATTATAAAASTTASNGKHLRAQTPECPSTDDDTYCGTGIGSLRRSSVRTAVQRGYSKRSRTRSRSSSRDGAGSGSSSRKRCRSRSRSSSSRRHDYYISNSSSHWHSSPLRRNSLQRR